MSIRIDASGEGLRRTASLPSSTNFSMSLWVRVITDRASNYRYVFNLENTVSPTDATAYLGVGWANTNTFQLVSSFGGSANFSSNPSTTDWFWCAMTCSGTGSGSLYGYFRNLGGTTVVNSGTVGTSLTVAQMGVMNNTYDEWVNGRVAAIKVWDAVLTQAELEVESWSYMPRRTANLHLVAPCLAYTDLVDYSGNAKTLTADGTLSTEDGPPIAWSCDPSIFPFAAAATTYEQEGYRFRNDDGSETTATWKANQDTTSSVTTATNFRLRFLINRSG